MAGALYPIPTVTWTEMAVGLVLYLTVNEILKRRAPSLKEPPFLRPFIVLHNLLLCAYSAWTFYRSMLVMIPSASKIYTYPFLLSHTELAWLAWVFYISKYYEFFDTWILLLQGKGGGFTYTLQVYHHIGAFATMGFGVMTRCDAYWIFVVYNSFIHTLMYLYYGLTAMRALPGLTRLIKPYITMLQITQFVAGIGATVPYFFLPSMRADTMAMYALVLIDVYVVGLIVLFVRFYQLAYKKDVKPKKL